MNITPKYSFQQAVVICLKKYITFEGRARRSEYWWFALLQALFGFLSVFYSEVLSGIVALIFFLPSWAVLVRRLHDIGKTGWWCLLSLLPIVGAIILLVFTVQDSEPYPNKYGESPKYVS